MNAIPSKSHPSRRSFLSFLFFFFLFLFFHSLCVILIFPLSPGTREMGYSRVIMCTYVNAVYDVTLWKTSNTEDLVNRGLCLQVQRKNCFPRCNTVARISNCNYKIYTSGIYKYTFFDILNWNFVNIFPSSYSFMIFPDSLIYRE